VPDNSPEEKDGGRYDAASPANGSALIAFNRVMDATLVTMNGVRSKWHREYFKRNGDGGMWGRMMVDPIRLSLVYSCDGSRGALLR